VKWEDLRDLLESHESELELALCKQIKQELGMVLLDGLLAFATKLLANQGRHRLETFVYAFWEMESRYKLSTEQKSRIWALFTEEKMMNVVETVLIGLKFSRGPAALNRLIAFLEAWRDHRVIDPDAQQPASGECSLTLHTLDCDEIVNAMATFVTLYILLTQNVDDEQRQLLTQDGTLSCEKIIEKFPSNECLVAAVQRHQNESSPTNLWISEIEFVESVLFLGKAKLLAEESKSLESYSKHHRFIYERCPNIESSHHEPCCGVGGSCSIM